VFNYGHDRVGTRTSVSEFSGARVTWTYDAANRLTNEHRSGTNAYDTTHVYDAVGNRALEQTGTQRTTFTQDAANQLKSSTAPSGVITTYTYDRRGEPSISKNTSTYPLTLRNLQEIKALPPLESEIHYLLPNGRLP
jgi:YD repeat-containing protein